MAAPIECRKTQKLLTDVHSGLTSLGSKTYLVRGNYFYYHYICDGHDDRGWGCGYRTLQSLCSWVNLQKQKDKVDQISKGYLLKVPSIPEIQNALVTMRDKPESFVNSKEWIGSFEVCLCLDYFYDVPCKILHINSGKEILSHMEAISNHFKQFGSPIMMGGESDTSSKGILGVCEDPPALLVMVRRNCRDIHQ
ncbi:Peptidase C78 [Mactra antiquata]